MIQRVQSVMLALVAIVMVVVLFVPNWKKAGTDTSIVQTGMEVSWNNTKEPTTEPSQTQSRPAIMISALLVSALAAFSLFSYTNRKRQMLIGSLNSLALVVCLGAILYQSMVLQKANPEGEPGKYQIGLFLVMMAIVMNLIANRFIRRDERLVRSMDRVR